MLKYNYILVQIDFHKAFPPSAALTTCFKLAGTFLKHFRVNACCLDFSASRVVHLGFSLRKMHGNSNWFVLVVSLVSFSHNNNLFSSCHQRRCAVQRSISRCIPRSLSVPIPSTTEMCQHDDRTFGETLASLRSLLAFFQVHGYRRR